MRNRLILILLVLAIGVFYFVYYENSSISNPVQEVEFKKATKIKPLDLLSQDKVKKTVNKTVNKAVIGKIDKIDSKVHTPVYDIDPVVDTNLILNKHIICYGFLSEQSNRGKHYIRQLELQLDEKQKKFHRDYIKHCEKLNQENPNLKLTDLKTMRRQLTNAKATSLWGKIIKGDIDAKTLSDFEVLDLLKQNNLSILTHAPEKLSDYYNRVIHWDLEDVLANHQYDYVKQIQAYAHQALLCSIGSDCGPNSSVMAMYCYSNTRGCGLDFIQYISQVLTLGQQADIQLALVYLQQKYQ